MSLGGEEQGVTLLSKVYLDTVRLFGRIGMLNVKFVPVGAHFNV